MIGVEVPAQHREREGERRESDREIRETDESTSPCNHHPTPLLIMLCGLQSSEPRQLRQLRRYRAGEMIAGEVPA
jgi:hypothetical protein